MATTNSFDPKHLPPALRSLVRRASTLWGDVLKEEAGEATFAQVEALRQRMSRLRTAPESAVKKALHQEFSRLRKLPPGRLGSLVHAFSALLEIMNACENAYRSHRIRSREMSELPQEAGREILLVLTSHPTEARSATLVKLLGQIQTSLQDLLVSGPRTLGARQALRAHFRILWRLRLSPSKKPSVEDEARSVIQQVLRPEMLEVLCGDSLQDSQLLLRTWVGGDKDGHPGVNARVLRRSLQLSRDALRAGLQQELESYQSTLERLRHGGRAPWSAQTRNLEAKLQSCLRALKETARLRQGDNLRLQKLRTCMEALLSRARQDFQGTLPPTLKRAEKLLKTFPGLVLPLELRESAELLSKGRAIRRMLQTLASLAGKGEVQDYARGLVISQVETLDDLKAGVALVAEVFGGRLPLPVIPLFEKASALEASTQILRAYGRLPPVQQALRREWKGNLEIMLGYSDSAKEMGVLPSRHLIRETVRQLERLPRNWEWTYFHGSGGSVARGGGSLEEQCSWWPASSLQRFKVTLQGEIVQRSFATPEILWSYADKIRRLQPRTKAASPSRLEEQAFAQFLSRISQHYTESVADRDFLSLVKEATAYRYLANLRIGSRPSKRKPLDGITSLRAIPWVLAWTQTRLLLPTWWGVGTAWQQATPAERLRLKSRLKKDPLFLSFVKQLGFTLAKIEPGVWDLYLENSPLAPELKKRLGGQIQKELRAAQKAFVELSGQKQFLWFRPWLGDSILMRAPLIHPLNLAQIVAIERQDADLLSETVMGVASGMLTTG